MSSDYILKDEDGKRYSYDNLYTKGYLSGQPEGVNAAFSYIRSEARNLFDQGRDEEAKTLRKLANNMLETLKHSMEMALIDHNENYPACLDED